MLVAPAIASTLKKHDCLSELKSLNSITESVQRTMRECKEKFQNVATIRSTADFSPDICVRTRWFGKYLVSKRFLKLRISLINVADSSDG